MNILENRIKCVECGSTKLIKDFERKEIFCSHCGLVLLDSSILTLNQRQIVAENHIEESKYKKTRKIQYSRMKHYFHNFI